MGPRSRVVPVRLSDETVINVEVRSIGEQEVAFKDFSFGHVVKLLESLTGDLKKGLQTIQPDRAEVKFGVELAVESGALTALIAKGTANANLEVTLEWKSETTK
jgi:hypothetical protein